MRPTMRGISRGLLLVLAVPAVSFAQLLEPEGELPRLPTDGGVLTVKVPASFPVFAIASSPTDGGMEHALVWGADGSKLPWRNRSTQLTFFSLTGGSVVRVFASNGGVQAKGARVQRLAWPAYHQSWSLSDLSAADADGARRFVLTEWRTGGCPGGASTWWFQLRGGRISALLRTGFMGEGGGDSLYFEGTVALWPDLDGGLPAATGMCSAGFFAPVTDVAPSQRVLVYNEQVEKGQLWRASRTLYRYADGRLERVRIEQFDAGQPLRCVTE